MQTEQVRERIRENINEHHSYLTNKEGSSAGVPEPSSMPRSDYQTAKHRPIYFETEVDPIIEDELKREQQKCKILEERLRNKQVFITQLKEFQAELTHAFEESQAELNVTKDRNQDLRREINKLTEANQQLEKLVVHMEYMHLSRFEKNNSPSKIPKEKNRSYPLLRDQEHRSYSHRQLPTIPLQIPQETLDLASAVACKPQQVMKQSKSIGKFLHYLIEMVTACSPEINHQPTLKQRLKYCWKWLKGLVKQSARIRDLGDETKAERDKLQRLLKTASANDLSTQVERLIAENKQYIHVIKLAMDFHRLPQSCTARQLEQFFKQRRK